MKPLAEFREDGDFGMSLSVTLLKREGNDQILQCTIDSGYGDSQTIVIPKYKFNELVQEVYLKLQNN